MTWTKLSDDFSDECWTLSDGAYRLLVEMLNYSNRKLLDNRIPKDELRRFAKRPEAAAELVADGSIRDEGSAYVIVFHSAYQPTREQVIKIQERNAKNGRKGGRPRRNPTGLPNGNPARNPSGNPGGRDGTGHYGEVISESENAKPVTTWPVVDIPPSGKIPASGNLAGSREVEPSPSPSVDDFEATGELIGEAF